MRRPASLASDRSASAALLVLATAQKLCCKSVSARRAIRAPRRPAQGRLHGRAGPPAEMKRHTARAWPSPPPRAAAILQPRQSLLELLQHAVDVGFESAVQDVLVAIFELHA
eukprot:CAMPEP_0173219584 /NCGR_PEP_ID=MMETSP1142-20121109/1680_1 /TAXON_ID=483371 /ORGANISM="non described non described, Strain CCMP2298" /LENGTH=111 /DNA_ID=CAMNT_0014147387 /DNA_START=493 /DNA_END=829 /DNA_ORIENTATION=+